MKKHAARADYIAASKGAQRFGRRQRVSFGRTALKKTRTETRIEVHEIWIITDPQAPLVVCDVCADQQSAMIGPEEAALVAGVSLRTIFRWVEAGQVHYQEQPDNGLLVCPNSLPGRLDATPVRGLLPSA